MKARAYLEEARAREKRRLVSPRDAVLRHLADVGAPVLDAHLQVRGNSDAERSRCWCYAFAESLRATRLSTHRVAQQRLLADFAVVHRPLAVV